MRRKNSESGFSLVIVVAMMALLSFLGMLVLDTAYIDTELARQDRESYTALYVAEAGLSEGVRTLLEDDPYNLDEDTGNRAAINDGPTVDTAQACPEQSSPCTDLTWHRLTAGPFAADEWVSYETGSFRVIAAVDEAYDEDGRWRVLVRSLGRSNTGSTRMIEVVLGVVGQ